VMGGDGSFIMLSAELITYVEEGIKITVGLLDNRAFGSIGSLSEYVGSEGFGTNYRYRNSDSGELDGGILPLDLVMNAKRYGVDVQEAEDYEQLEDALQKAMNTNKTQIIVATVDKEQKVT